MSCLRTKHGEGTCRFLIPLPSLFITNRMTIVPSMNANGEIGLYKVSHFDEKGMLEMLCRK